MPDVMLDLETMGTRAGSAVVAIGAVAFDATLQTLGPRFYMAVDLQSAMNAGGKVDGDTIMFWIQQDEAAKAALIQDRAPLSTALRAFSVWLGELGSAESILMWGNGSAFDNVILRCAYEALGWPAPWSWWNDRCYRTARKLLPSVAAPEFTGTTHHALHDAEHQAAHALRLLRKAERAIT